MNQIALLMGFFLVGIPAFRVMARLASLVFKIILFLVLANIGHAWWQYGRH